MRRSILSPEPEADAMEKTFDAASEEARIAALWERTAAFAMGANAKPGRPPFSILLPPPNVTGSLHMGHAFNHTLMDILTRWHRMQGDDVLWQPGLDHAGIATQMVVERELTKAGNAGRREMGRDAFVEKVWEWKEASGGTILEQCKRLGDSFDLSRNRFTMDDAYKDAVLKVFVRFYNDGLIFRGKRLVNWDPHFETAISDLEVENVEVDGHMWHFKYPLENGETYEYVEKDADGNVTLRETRDYIAIATTRPETMLGDGAVAVHPSDARYAPIVGKRVLLPLADRYIPIIADEYPDPAFGSGAVKITGAHDFNDYEVAKRHDLPMYVLMDTKARMVDEDFVPETYRGMDRFDARKAVVADIDALGLLLAIEDKKITQPLGDRSKTVIEPYLTDQWFLDAKTLAQPALAAVREGHTRILPEQHEKVYYHWLENIEPWCISRQLWWGHQIPVWFGPSLKNDPIIAEREPIDRDLPREFCALDQVEAVRQAQAYYGEEFWVFCDSQRPAGYSRSHIGGTKPHWVNLYRDPDVLDTWFSSGIWPLGTLGWPDDTDELKRFYPTSVLVTGFDILFFWVARMMMMQLQLTKDWPVPDADKVPFRDVYIHALVRDEKGKKMSKSLGNVLDPLELIDEYGADAVRFTLASMAAMGRDLRLSKDRIAGYRNFGTKLWNAARFADMNGCKPDPAFDPASVTLTANRWIVGETGRLRETLDTALAAYRFNDAAAALYAHVWGKVCDWYVELAKPLFNDSEAAEETRATMAWVLDQCLILLHPFMPFITEALWGQIAARPKLLVHTDWPGYGAELVEPSADAEMGWVIGLIEEIRSLRAAMRVPAGAKTALVELAMREEQGAALERNRTLVARLARVERFERANAAPQGAVTLTVGGATFCLPLADVIDIAAERERLSKAVEKLDKEASGLRAKLANAAFVARAPEEVVDENRTRLAAIEAEIAILSAALARLAAL